MSQIRDLLPSGKEGMPMSVIDLIAVLSFAVGCFIAGYTIGKDKKQK